MLRSVCSACVGVLTTVAWTAALQGQAVQQAASVPRLINVSGTFRPVDGQPPAPVETVRLAIYADESGGVPLWEETQTVRLSSDGRYQLLLGATLADGVPLDVFASGDARWFGMRWARPGEVEGPRVRITTVPYALRASDADTLGGKPASAYLLAPAGDTTSPGTTTTAATRASASATANPAGIINSGTVNQVAKYVNASDVGPSAIFESGGFVGVNTTTPLDVVHSRFTNTNGGLTGYAVQNLGNTATSYSGMLFYDQNGALGQFQGFNNSTHEYRINNIAQTSGVFNGSINFMIGSTSRFFIGSNAAVGIGTSSPPNGLEVSNALTGAAQANIFATTFSPNASAAVFTARKARGTQLAPAAVQAGDNIAAFVGRGYGATGFGSGGGLMIVRAAENWTDAAQGTALDFRTTSVGTNAPANRMTIDPSGNVGIGTTAPGNALEVVRDGSQANIFSTSFTGALGHGSSSALGLLRARGTSAAPSAVLAGDVLGVVFMNGYGATNFGSGGAGLIAAAAENWTDAAEGNVIGLETTALGSASPALHLAVLPNGNVSIDSLDVTGFPIAADKLQVFGDVRVGTTGTNGCVKNFAGTGLIGTCSSDRRLKKNITPFGSVLEQVTALQPVHFNWRADEFPDRHFGDDRAYGLIAQDVEEVLPELVVTGDDGYKQVDYSKLPLLTIQAVKELKQRVAELERLIEEMRATSSHR
jgi:hypothetical protein